jgi:hypothetical protein
MNRKLGLQTSLVVVGIAQLFFGAAFTFAPGVFGAMLGLSAAPEWAYWMFSMFGARAFGFAFGMFLAARDPLKHTPWILAMIGVQVIDWLGTIYYLASGAVTLAQVSTASFLPLIFIALLIAFYPRQAALASK